MIVHELALWFWYIFGALVYIGKRAFYLINGPNPVANNLNDFLKVAGVPIVFRLIVDSGVYWLCFTPQLAQAGLKAMGWESAAWVVSILTQFGVAALFFGLSIDPMVDWFIGTVVNRIPFLKDWWPQMPGPLPQKAVVQAQVVETTQKVTQLATTTTVIQPPKEGE